MSGRRAVNEEEINRVQSLGGRERTDLGGLDEVDVHYGTVLCSFGGIEAGGELETHLLQNRREGSVCFYFQGSEEVRLTLRHVDFPAGAIHYISF